MISNQRDSGSLSPWQTSAVKLVSGTEPKHSHYDVIIIGAGITGITTAYLLQQRGKKCLVLEGHNIGYGTTGGTTAHLNTFFDSTYPEIDSNFGKDGSKLVAKAGQEALHTIKSLIHKFNIDCDLESKPGFLFSESENESKQLRKIFQSAIEAGVAAKQADTNELPIPFHECVEFSDQAQFHPLKYINGLAHQYLLLGGVLLDNSFVRELTTQNGIHTVKTDNHQFSATNVVYATHIPPGITQLSFRCSPYRSYVIGVKLKDKTQYPKALAYDLQEPYHYIRTHNINGEQLLIVGGADHKTGHNDPSKSYKELENYASTYFHIDKVVYKWSSQYYVPVDGLPYIGPMSSKDDTVFIASGFNGNGMTWGTISGNLITDLILGVKNPYEELFSPQRLKPIAGLSEFLKENADVAYHFLSDRFKTDELEKLSKLKAGEGNVLDFHGTNVAIYKSIDGAVSAFYPTCTHAGCTVKFNCEEKSWDCPCHGGRFDLNGKVISGPARKDLVKVNFS